MSQTSLFDYDARLQRLSPAEREVYQNVDLRGRSIQTEAVFTERSRSTVDTLLHRARRKLGEAPEVCS